MGRTQPKTDFSQGPVWRRILDQAGPLIVAQLVHLLYNVVDRIYIGHMGDGSGLALTGVGLTFPIVTLIMAFAALFGTGGVPLFSIARGAGDEARARRILGNSFTLQLVSSALLMVVGYLFMRPILFAFGASEDKLHLLRPGENPPEDRGKDEGDALAGKLCPKCGRMFFTALEDGENDEYLCPHCGERIKPVPLTPENAPIAKPIPQE